MTIKTSGSLAFSEIQAEFGGSSPISLSEYFAGGAYVPAGTSGINGAVPSSPNAISVSKFYGTSAYSDVYSVTLGYASFGADSENQYEGSISQGYYDFTSFGAAYNTPRYGFIDHTPISIYSGGAVLELVFSVDTTYQGGQTLSDYGNFRLWIATYTGSPPANSGWSAIIVNGTTYNRSAASYSAGTYNGQVSASWDWGTYTPFYGMVNTVGFVL
jgi:hypothetical protein